MKAASSFVAKNLEIISELDHCFELWKEFSPQKTLFDTWEFRFAFYQGYRYKPHFLLFKNISENLAVLPLWYDIDEKRYTWFGSDWQEENSFFTKDLNFITSLLSAAPSPLFLNAISKESVGLLRGKINFENDDPKYILNLEGFRNHEDYLMTLKRKTRQNLRKDRRRIERQNPEIIINNFSDFNYLVKLSKKRFQEKGSQSSLEDPRVVETFKEVIKLGGKSYQTRMITIRINGETAGVDLVCLYNNTYFALRGGYNVQNFPGIGNFMNLFEIDDAISLGMEKIDFLQMNCGWKDQYFETVPLFKYEK